MSRSVYRLFLFVALVAAFGVAGAHAQGIPGMMGRSGSGSSGGRGLGIGTYDNKPVTHERVVTGVVHGKDGQPLKGATVFLKNDTNQDVKSVTVDATGKFRFIQLSRVTDYKLWAETKERKTEPKIISQFDNRDIIDRELTVE